jgi:phage gp46-like protein
MDYTLTLTQGLPEVALSKSTSLLNNVYLSLAVRKGSLIHRIDFGSRLHLLKRIDTNSLKLAADYCKEALQWLIDIGRLVSVSVAVEPDLANQSQICLAVSCVRADGGSDEFSIFYKVA